MSFLSTKTRCSRYKCIWDTDQRVVDRVHDLANTPAHFKFLSCEPLISPLDNRPLLGINWDIVNGESGPGTREMKEKWVRSIQCQCERRYVPFLFEQWGGVRKESADNQVGWRIPNGCVRTDFALQAMKIIREPASAIAGARLRQRCRRGRFLDPLQRGMSNLA